MKDQMPKMKPMLHLSSEECPEIAKWKVGKTYELSLKVKQIGMMMMDKKVMADFEIQKVTPESESKEKYDKEVVKKAISAIR